MAPAPLQLPPLSVPPTTMPGSIPCAVVQRHTSAAPGKKLCAAKMGQAVAVAASVVVAVVFVAVAVVVVWLLLRSVFLLALIEFCMPNACQVSQPKLVNPFLSA